VTTALIKGANCPLPTQRVVIEVSGGAPLDVAGLLCTEAGKVRTDDDFVFYGAPSGPGVQHRPAGAAAADGIEVTLTAVPPDIAKVVVTASLDGAGPPNFAAMPAFSITARDAITGTVIAEFRPDGLARETALICMEVYRRQGAWKLRAVGQGYESGLAGIATSFGVDIATDPPPTATAPLPPPPTGAPLPPPPADAHLPPPPAGAAHLPPPPAAGPNLQKLTLDKGTVSLAKRQTVSLTKQSGPALQSVAVGLGWDPAERGRNIDLDASCILFDAGLRKLDLCWFMSKKAGAGAFRHSGDNLTGAGAGDDETIEVDLTRIPADVAWLVFTVNSYQRHPFTQVRNAYCRLVDRATGAELVRYNLTESEPRTGVLMAALRRVGPTWDMTALGEFADGRTVKKMIEPAAGTLRALAGA
jgi:stress response protein SCP2